jgi:hypothetical protein
MVGKPEDWPWSSYQSMIGEATVPKWLDMDWLLSQFDSYRKSTIDFYCRCMSKIGDHFGVHYMTVSRAVRQFEKNSRE